MSYTPPMVTAAPTADSDVGSTRRALRALHVTFWLIVAAFTFAWLSLHDRLAAGPALLSALAWAAPGAAFTALIVRFAPKLTSARRMAAAWIASSLAWWLSLASINVVLLGRRAPAPDVFALAYMAFVVAAFVPVVAAVRGNLEAQRARLSEAQSVAALRETQLQALRWQLNPHFLFNALNAISAQIEEEPSVAQSMVSDLSALLRDSLDSPELGTVDEELRRVELYLRLQQRRFEDGLVTQVDVDPSTRRAALPSLLLQPLVENAVVHGRRCASPVEVRVSVQRAGTALRITISNTGRIDEPRRDRVGLSNVRERLALFAPERHRFTLRESDGWVHAEIELD